MDLDVAQPEASSSSVPSLPPEIWDAVICHLHADNEALIACCLTCRAWLPTSRYYLFRHVRLKTRKSYASFLDSLQHSPDVLGWIKRLTITESSRSSHHPFDVSPMLVHLPNITHLHLRVAWAVSVCAPSLLASGIVFPSLTTLILRGGVYDAQEMPLLLSAFPMLSNLRLCDVNDRNLGAVPQPIAHPNESATRSDSSGLSELVLLRTSVAIEYFLFHSTLRFYLQSIEIDGNFCANSPCPRVLWESQASLHSLVIHHTPDHPGRRKMSGAYSAIIYRRISMLRQFLQAVPHNFGSLQLRSLRSLSIEPKPNWMMAAGEHIVDILHVITPGQIEDIRVGFVLQRSHDFQSRPDFWRIDEALTSLIRPGVRFTIAVVYDDGGVHQRHAMLKGFLKNFRQLIAGGADVRVMMTDALGRFSKETFRAQDNSTRALRCVSFLICA